jgi:hypothetical protein
MNLKHSTLLISSCLAFALTSCGGGEKEKETEPAEQSVDTTQEKVSDAKEDLDETTDFQFHVFIANIPSPLETMVNLNKAQLPADKALLNNTGNADKYNTLTKKALNYGVYGTDMSYLAAFDMTQDVSDYFATVKSMAEELGAVEQFNKVLTDRFQANLDNHDSLIILMDNALGATDDYLKNNQRLELACLTMTGSWIESQYILVNALVAANGKGDLEKLNQSMVSQKNNLKSLVELLGEQKDKDCKSYKTELEGLKAAYDKLNSTADVNEANLREIAGKLKTVREKIVK